MDLSNGLNSADLFKNCNSLTVKILHMIRSLFWVVYRRVYQQSQVYLAE